MDNKTLHQLYVEHTGKVSDKWSIYLAEYDRIFAEYRKQPIQLLEIGIQNGGSLEIWSKYFENAKKLVGCDINPDCARLTYDDQRISVVVGDANDDSVHETVLKHVRDFDIVIDDGSHRSSDIVKSFARYFPHVADGGVFVAEDLHCSYWQGFEGGLYDPFSSIAFFKRLADIANYEHWGIEKNIAEPLKGIFTKYGCSIEEETLRHIHSVEFINSVCVVRKVKPERNSLGVRVVAGSTELVVPGHLALQSSPNVAPNENANQWTARSLPPDEELQLRLQEIADRDAHIANLTAAIEEIQNSSSWRITKPVRVIGQQVKRAKHLVRLVPKAVKHAGGVRNSLLKAKRLIQNDGIAGIKRGLLAAQISVGDNADDQHAYAEWIRRYDTISDELRASMSKQLETWDRKPLISVIIPTYNAKPEWLIETIESVRNQIYPHWELCIADDASTVAGIRPILESYVEKDSRIRVVFREQNGHIAAASNSALELVSGEWVCLLDHDDLLAEHALFWLADTVNKNPDAELIYSDEDKIDTNGKRSNPFFKPDWSPHLAVSQAYLGHLTCYSTIMIRALGGFRTEVNGSQDYDLWLRASLIAKEPKHVPRILYHWRMHEQSTAQNAASKPYAHEAGKVAVDCYLKSRYRGTDIQAADGDYLFTYKPKFVLPDDLLVSIIIPTRDKVELLRVCIDSIVSQSSWKNFEILVLDNGSKEIATAEYFQQITSKDSRIKVVRADIPFNWSKLNNIGANAARGDVFIFLNNDTKVISRDWIQYLAGYARLPDVGTVGGLLLFEDGTIQHSGVVVGMGGWADHVFRALPSAHNLPTSFVSPVLTRNVLAVTGACTAISKDRYIALGGYDESFLICGSDVEIGIRAHKKGYYNVMCAEAKLFHYESKTRTPHVPEEDFKQSNLKYAPYRVEQVDPFYNPNLSLKYTRPVPRS